MENSPTRPPTVSAAEAAVTVPVAELPVMDPAPEAMPTKPPTSAALKVELTLPLALEPVMLALLAYEPTKPPVRMPPTTAPDAELLVTAPVLAPSKPPT